MKTIIAAVLGIAVGVAVGAGILNQKLTPALAEYNQKLSESERALAALRSESDSAQDKLARLEKERSEYDDKLDALYAQLESARKMAPAAATNVPMALEEELVANAAEAEASPEATDPRTEGRQGRRGGGDSRWGGTPEERDARRQEFVGRMQENLTNFFTGELDKSATPAMQERLVQLEEKTYAMFEIRSQMRDAESDAEQAALEEAYSETMNSARQIMREQQQDILGTIATEFGITSASEQAAFEQAVRTAVSSPIFSDNPGAMLRVAGQEAFGRGGPPGGGFRGPGGGR